MLSLTTSRMGSRSIAFVVHISVARKYYDDWSGISVNDTLSNTYRR